MTGPAGSGKKFVKNPSIPYAGEKWVSMKGKNLCFFADEFEKIRLRRYNIARRIRSYGDNGFSDGPPEKECRIMDKDSRREISGSDVVLRAAGESHMGLSRKKNEDNFGLVSTPDGKKLLVLVADGIGGHSRGEMASYICCREMISAFLKEKDAVCSSGSAAQFLKKEVERVNSEIYARNQAGGMRRPMGTTVNCALFLTNSVTVINAGDSRAYETDDSGRIRRLSTDHSFKAVPAVSRNERNKARYENVIYRAVGLHKNLEIEISQYPLLPGTRYLFCTDGMYRSLSDKKIATILSDADSPRDALNVFMRSALVAGGRDNITGIAVFTDGEF